MAAVLFNVFISYDKFLLRVKEGESRRLLPRL